MHSLGIDRMAWSWTRLQENIQDGRVERQVHEYGCGAACIVMLLRDRGITSDQLVVCAGLHLPSTAQELAKRLNEFSGSRYTWIGGHLDLDGRFGRPHVQALGETGSWAALLVPARLREGHWVVVDGAPTDTTISIRDPAGASYGIPEGEFYSLMRYTVAVFERGR